MNIRGHQPYIFKKKPDEKYLCVHCIMILRNPVFSSCGHRYCRGCFAAIIKASGQDTPVCQPCRKAGKRDETLSVDRMYPDKAISRDMSECQVQCPNGDCGWEGNFKKYEQEHIMNCKSQVIACENKGCRQQVDRCQYVEHIEVCTAKSLECDHGPHSQLQALAMILVKSSGVILILAAVFMCMFVFKLIVV